MPPPEQPPQRPSSHSFQAPKGTRDLYPQDLLRRRYIEKMWRDTSIRHGFEEIDGPTFEHLDLYTVKSGEGIVSELFSFRREGGEKDYALRPEFTPTLARMYAAKAGSLPKPTKWFWQQNCFRAEKPQRGRLREFGQWNIDFIGGDDTPQSKADADADVIKACIDALAAVGLSPQDVRIRLNSRQYLEDRFNYRKVPAENRNRVLATLDQIGKLPKQEVLAQLLALGFSENALSELAALAWIDMAVDKTKFSTRTELQDVAPLTFEHNTHMSLLQAALEARGIANWCQFNFCVVRGLAYYTGMVFEVHEAGGKERAIAGGGRYDNLIEMFGGPPTPAVGFGMGDVVLSLVLQDRGLMPEGQALLDKLSEPPASLRPDIFVISNGQPESAAALRPLVAQLRRGGPAKPLHARHSYKATKNIGKLLQEASAVHARFAAIIENANEATLKNLTTGAQEKTPLDAIAARVAQS